MKSPSLRTRLLVVSVVGLISGAIAELFAPWQFAVLFGWDTAAAIFAVWVWLDVGGFTPGETRKFATREDAGRVSSSLLLIGASVASLVGTGFDLVKASQGQSDGRVALTLIALATVALSWIVVHTVFALPAGGIDFKNDDDPPDYQDFAYVAFTVGMTFQVSDTDIQARPIRRTVLRHALLAYLFGAVILAVAINLIASLIK
jgi:uncharacterized membrane protein